MKGQKPELLATGIPGFDEILHGGLPPRRAYLAVGGPGTGKTTFGFHFLETAHPEPGLFVSLGQGAQQLQEDFGQFGLQNEHIHVYDLAPGSQPSPQDESYTLLQSWEVEGPSLIDNILSKAEELQPGRIFLDSMTHLRQLSPDDYQFRKQILALLNRLTSQGITVGLSAEADGVVDVDLAYLCDGIFQFQFQFQGQGRKVAVRKLRGHSFSEGEHTIRIEGAGLRVFPRLLPGEHGQAFTREIIPSGVPALDELTHGGINRGTVTIISGPTGVGKTTLGIQYMKEGATRGERSVVFTFEENADGLMERLGGIGMPLKEMQQSGHLAVAAVEPMHYNTDEFAHVLRREVEDNGTRIVMIDSLSGFKQSVRGTELVEAIHSLCRYLTNMGVTVILINESLVSGAVQERATEAGVSYLGDAILFLKYVELNGELLKAIGMLKKRSGDFEKTIRKFDVTPYGLQVGAPLRKLRGILHGASVETEEGPSSPESGRS